MRRPGRFVHGKLLRRENQRLVMSWERLEILIIDNAVSPKSE